ncbi:MAG: hypothetical protein E7175_00440 [Erysipelotrichaceae bacterium]|nr:hypothetical protein [Erysipelotrichaceae bacterium]
MDTLEIETLKRNEINANKSLAIGSLFTAGVLLILFILYITGAFYVSPKALVNIYVSFPILFALLVSAFFTSRTRLVENPRFKYGLIIQYILVMFVLNILLPKHAIMGWALSLVIMTHYYNPKVSIFTFISIAILMFVAIYLGMLYGEWDANLMGGSGQFGKIVIDGVEIDIDNATYEQRVSYLAYLRDNGDNRFLKAFLYYYLPRLLILGLITQTCYLLSGRASRLLKEETEQAKRNQKLEGELEVAKSIQDSVLPRSNLETTRENVYAIMDPAKEIGGDFYDYFYIDNNHMAFVIADVSGKGIPGALFMMKAEALIKSLALTLKTDTAHIMERSNFSLCQNNKSNMFVTCWLGILDLSNGELRYTNAGHTDPLLSTSKGIDFIRGHHGVVLGAVENTKYKENVIKLERGERVILYTDGVTEAHNKKDELFGEARLLEFARKKMKDNAKDIIHDLREELNVFSEGLEQFDDITMLVIEYQKGALLMESKIFNADVKELDNLFEYSRSLLEVLDFPKRDIIMINTALEEVFVNVAKYAYEGTGEVEVTLSNDKNKVTFVFRDSGKAFNPLEKEDPNLAVKAEDREIGGLGIYMVKNIMDETFYEYKDNHNVLTLVKYRNGKH